MFRSLLVAVAACAALLSSLPAQQEWLHVYDRDGTTGLSRFGSSLAGIGDLDRDGIAEILVGSPGDPRQGVDAGSVQVLHGEDGALLFDLLGGAPGDRLGYAVVTLGDWNGDRKPEFAAGAPTSSGSAGSAQGRVRVYDGGSGSLLDEIEGPAAGALFGFSLAATDSDGDGQMELAVGSPGAFGEDGAVYFYRWNGSALDLLPQGALLGQPGSGERFGFALAQGGGIPPSRSDWLVVSAPRADDGGWDSGAVVVVVGRRSILRFAPGVPQVGAGFSLSATREGKRVWIAAGAPGAGRVYLWEATTGMALPPLSASTPGGRFGHAVSFLGDRNFDGRPDLAVGAPLAGPGGELEILNFLNPGAPRELWKITGAAASWTGAAVAPIGDVAFTGQPDLAVGCPEKQPGGGQPMGGIEVWTPPDSDRPPLELVLLSPIVLDSTVDLECRQVKGHGDVYFYAGTSLAPSTSAEGFELEISDLLGGSGGHDSFDLAYDVLGGSASSAFTIPITLAPGTTLYFQTVERRSLFVRRSPAEGGPIEDRPMEFWLGSPLEVGQTTLLLTRYAHRQTLGILYYFLGDGPGNSTYLTLNTGLSSFVVISAGGSIPDQYGNASYAWLVPASLHGVNLRGRQVYLSSVSWFAGNERLAVIGPHLIR